MQECGPIITVVSGLPRSGTSLMMQMLVAGGLPALTDESRGADADNPLGYFELERVKRLRIDASWLDEARGRALKVVAPLVLDLPPTHEYRIVFMERALPEVLASQAQMLERRGAAPGSEDPSLMADAFAASLARVRESLEARQIPIHAVPHRLLIEAPQRVVEEIVRFCDLPLDIDAMVAVVNPDLHRQRGTG